MGAGIDAVVTIHDHARLRMAERGAEEAEVVQAVRTGEQFLAKHGRTGFRHNYAYNREWRGHWYAIKQVEAIAVQEAAGWVVVTVMTKYF